MRGPRFTADYRSVLLIAKLFFLVASMAMLTGPATARAEEPKTPETYWAYIGTYTSGNGKDASQGIYVAEFNAHTGHLGEPKLAARAIDPSFLAISPNKKYLYAVSEVDSVGGRPGGAVIAFKIDPATGSLTKLNQHSTIGGGPAHITIDSQGKNVLVANYGGGSVTALPLDPDGKLRHHSSFHQHRGKGANPSRQGEPHAHSVNLSPDNRFAFVADLGLDKILIYKFDAATGKLTPNDPPFAKVAPGSGPRHFTFHPNGHYAYVINEMGNTVTAFAYDAAKGSLTEIQNITTLPDDYKKDSFTAEVVAHPTGKFLFGSNRRHDSIAAYMIDSSTGKLTIVDIEPTQGKNPRNFVVDPTGGFLLAENGDSNSIVIFRIDPSTGKLDPTGQSVTVPKPVCIRMIPKPAPGAAK